MVDISEVIGFTDLIQWVVLMLRTLQIRVSIKGWKMEGIVCKIKDFANSSFKNKIEIEPNELYLSIVLVLGEK